MRRGDERAFEELYSRYGTRIGAYIFATVGDHGRAEDIAQEVFISALRRLRASEHPIAFRPWLYEIAKNACIDEFRRTRRTQQVSLDDDHPAQGSRAMVSSAPSPDAAVESKQQLDDLCGAFGGLSETHHRIIVLRELEGLSYDQIGDRLGVSRAAVESTLFRARRRLTEEYEELVSGRRCQQVQLVIDSSNERAVRRFGVRQRRQLARHLAHCQPCRHHARVAGLADSLLAPPGLAGKIAALLPIPWSRWRRGGGSHATAASSPHVALSAQTLQTVARFAEPAAPAAVGLGRAAVTAAAVVMAGVGGGLVTGLSPHHVPSAIVRSAGRGPDGTRSASTSVRGSIASSSSSAGAGAPSGPGSAIRAGGAGQPAGSASSSTRRGGSGSPASSGNSSAPAPGAGAGANSPGSSSGAGGGAGSAGGGAGSAGSGAGSAGGAAGAQTPTGAAGSAAGGSTGSTPTGPLGALSAGSLGSGAPAPVRTVTGVPNPVLSTLPPVGLPSPPPVSIPPVPQVPALPHLGLGRLLH